MQDVCLKCRVVKGNQAIPRASAKSAFHGRFVNVLGYPCSPWRTWGKYSAPADDGALLLCITNPTPCHAAVLGFQPWCTTRTTGTIHCCCSSSPTKYLTLHPFSSTQKQGSRLGRPPLPVPAAQQSSYPLLQPGSPSSSESNNGTLPHSERASEDKVAGMPLGQGAGSRGMEGGQDARHSVGISASAAPQERGEGDPLEALQLPITQDRSLLSGLGDYYAARGHREAAA
eukprot:scaffold255627_cov23-Tisochrysis_lutea.AAC.1